MSFREGNLNGGLTSNCYTLPYVWKQGQAEILPESEVFLKTRRLEFIKLLDAALEAGVYIPSQAFTNKYLNAFTELELALAIRA